MSLFRTFFALSTVIFAASCTYQGGADNPVIRKFAWFSYLNGDDIRNVCADLGADRYRFVYNGIYEEQVRAYEVSFVDRSIKMQVTGNANLLNLELHDPFNPWRGATETLNVGEKELNLIRKSLVASAALQPAPNGLHLNSHQFYWTVAACVDGKFHFNAYKWPSNQWEDMQFDDVLFALDVTGVEPAEPRILDGVEISDLKRKNSQFRLQVGENGLVGYPGG